MSETSLTTFDLPGLPPEIIYHIMEFQPSKLLLLSLTCQDFLALTNSETLWRELYASILRKTHYALLLAPSAVFQFRMKSSRLLLTLMAGEVLSTPADEVSALVATGEERSLEIQAVVNVVKNHMAKPNLMKMACYTIRRLSFWCDSCSKDYLEEVTANRRLFQSLDCIPLLVQLLSLHPDDAELAPCVFCALGNIICNDVSRHAAIESHIITLATRWIKSNDSVYDVVDYATYVLFKICCRRIPVTEENAHIIKLRDQEVEEIVDFALNAIERTDMNKSFLKCYLYFLTGVTLSMDWETKKAQRVILAMQKQFEHIKELESLGYLICILKNLCQDSQENRQFVLDIGLLPKFMEILHRSHPSSMMIENTATILFKLLWVGAEGQTPQQQHQQEMIDRFLCLLASGEVSDKGLKCYIAAILADCARVGWARDYIRNKKAIPLIDEAAKVTQFYNDLMAAFH